MMGRLEQDQGQLFYSFCQEVVPDDHQVRAIASVLDLASFRPIIPHSAAPRSIQF
jgi:hypothetical protein